MSEKGQGEETTTGTGTGSGVGVDGTSAGGGGGGSQADQSGPSGGQTQTRERGEWSYPDPNAPEDPLGGLTPKDFEPPPTPEEGAQGEPQFPGGGPTDTRSGWDEPTDSGTRGGSGDDERDEEDRRAADRRQNEEDERRERGEDEPMTIDPPSLERFETKGAPTDRPPGMTDEQFEQWKKDNPTMLDKANTQVDVT
jgi:hypothetical protein